MRNKAQKTNRDDNAVCEIADGQNGQEMPENDIPFYEPFTEEEIKTASCIEDLFCLKRVDADG